MSPGMDQDFYESCTPKAEYGMVVDGTLRRVRFVRTEKWTSMNPKAIDKRRARTNFLELRDGLSDRPFSVGFAVERLIPWSAWMTAQVAISYLDLQTEPRSAWFADDYWRLDRPQIDKVAQAIERVGLSHPAVAVLNWPMASHKAPFGQPHWRFEFRHLVAVAEILDAGPGSSHGQAGTPG